MAFFCFTYNCGAKTFLGLGHWFLDITSFGNWAAMPLTHIMLELQLHVTYLDGHLYSTACKLSSCPVAMQICWNRGNCSHKKRVQLPQDWFGATTRMVYHCFGAPIWLPWCHVHTLCCYLKHFTMYTSKHKTSIRVAVFITAKGDGHQSLGLPVCDLPVPGSSVPGSPVLCLPVPGLPVCGLPVLCLPVPGLQVPSLSVPGLPGPRLPVRG